MKFNINFKFSINFKVPSEQRLHFRGMRWRAKSRSYRENVASACRVILRRLNLSSPSDLSRLIQLRHSSVFGTFAFAELCVWHTHCIPRWLRFPECQFLKVNGQGRLRTNPNYLNESLAFIVEFIFCLQCTRSQHSVNGCLTTLPSGVEEMRNLKTVSRKQDAKLRQQGHDKERHFNL